MVFTIIFEYLILGIIGGILKYTGAFVMMLFGRYKHPIAYYLNHNNTGIHPYLFGLVTIIILSCLIGKLL